MEFSKLIIAVFSVLITVCSGHEHICKVDEIQVQPNFDLKRIEGRWYEIWWSSYNFIPEEYRYRDYVHDYRYNWYTHRMNVTGSGRATLNSTCFHYNAFLVTDSAPGKLAYKRPESVVDPKGTITTSYWIVSTDYDNYIVTYGCPSIYANGTCDKSTVESWVWGRSPILSREAEIKVRETMHRICMTEDDYLSTDHGNECAMLSAANRLFLTGFIVWCLAVITVLPTMFF